MDIFTNTLYSIVRAGCGLTKPQKPPVLLDTSLEYDLRTSAEEV